MTQISIHELNGMTFKLILFAVIYFGLLLPIKSSKLLEISHPFAVNLYLTVESFIRWLIWGHCLFLILGTLLLWGIIE